jgi:hypothetical protein
VEGSYPNTTPFPANKHIVHVPRQSIIAPEMCNTPISQLVITPSVAMQLAVSPGSAQTESCFIIKKKKKNVGLNYVLRDSFLESFAFCTLLSRATKVTR